MNDWQSSSREEEIHSRRRNGERGEREGEKDHHPSKASKASKLLYGSAKETTSDKDVSCQTLSLRYFIQTRSLK